MSAAGVYESMRGKRDHYLERAREVSILTDPELLPLEGWEDTTLNDPPNSVGPDGLTSLVAKTLMGLFPPGTPAFRLAIPPEDRIALEEAGGADMTELEQALLGVETISTDWVETHQYRPRLAEIMKHLYVSGNVAVYMPLKPAQLHYFGLDKFVIKRDIEGKVLDAVILECVAQMDLPPKYRQEDGGVAKRYTRIRRMENGKYLVTQELAQGEILFSKKYVEDELPYFFPRFSDAAGRDYSYGYLTKFLGDLTTANALSEALNDAAAAAARLLCLRRPGSPIPDGFLDGADNGSVADGVEEDVTFVHLGNKVGDFRVAFDRLVDVENRLKAAFLITNFRQAERVTAEELRLQAQELETKLAGGYSLFSAELQVPLFRRVLRQLKVAGLIPAQLPNLVDLSIKTGLDALGRSSESFRLRQWITDVVGIFQESGLAALRIEEVTRKLGTLEGIADLDVLMKTQEEMAAEAEAAQQQAMAQQVAPEVAKGVMNG